MKYAYKDREGQIAELYGKMLNSIHEYFLDGVMGIFPGGPNMRTVIKKIEKNINSFKPEVEKLDHPILKRTFSSLEELCETSKKTLKL